MSKLEFEVIEASGRTGSISSRLLKGEEWTSEPNCRYPQTIVIRFPRQTQISKIELLVHRKYIPSRMELYATTSQSTSRSIPPVHLFASLGNITFKEKKSDTGRHELKTIFVDTPATFLKFSFGRNYTNISNPKNQIGIVELSVFGGEQPTGSQALGETSSTISIFRPRNVSSRRSNHSNATRSSSSTTSSSLNASSIWRISSRQSTASSRSRTSSKQNSIMLELKETLNKAEQAKIDAIEAENYALAKSARRAEIQLELIIKQIRDVERAKQKAIDEDDFDRAQDLTNQIRALRENAFEQVDIKFLNSIPNDPRPSSSQTNKTNMTSSTSASSVLRQFQDGRLKIDSSPAPNTFASAFQPIPLTPSTVVSEQYPHPDQLPPPKTQSSLGSTTISFQSDKSGSIKNDNLSGRHSAISSQNLTPSPHPDSTSPQPRPTAIRSPIVDQRPILPDSRLPNIRRLSDPTVYRSDGVEKNSTSSSLSSRLSSIFNLNRNKPDNDQQSNNSDQSKNKSETGDKPRNRFLEKENQVVPGARRKKSSESVTLDALLDNMHPSERQIATQAIDFFGLKTVSKIYAKNWEQRREGYSEVLQKLKNEPFSRSKSKDVARVVEFLVIKGLSDKLFNVYSVVLDLLKQLLGTYVVQNSLVESDGPRIVNSTYQLLVNRTGDTVNEKRFAAETFNAISSLLHGDSRIANFYMAKFMQPFDASHSTRTDQGKAKIVYDALVELYNSRLPALSTKNVCQFALECLNHTDAKVRDYGRKMIVFLYEREDHQQIRAALPKSNAAKKIPALRNLLDDLDKMDKQLNVDATTITRQTRFDTNPTIINETNGKKKRSKTRSPTRRKASQQNNQNVRLVTDKTNDENDPIDYSKQPQPRPESNLDSSIFSMPALRSILKNK